MKILAPLFATVLLAACSSPQGEADKIAEPAAASTGVAPTSAPMADMPAAAGTQASATGTVESVDAKAGKITIAHGPVDALKWPAMTMTFKAGNTDISSIKQGDQVTFEFISTGMDGTLTRIAHQ